MFESVTADILMKGAIVCVIGLATVFAVLAILWAVLELMRVIFTKKSTPKKQEADKGEEAPAATVDQKKENSKLIAILTAAVACILGKSANGLRIRSFRRIDNGTPVWNKVARRDNTLV